MSSAGERRESLKAVYEQARGCTACPLHETRTNVVFGAGNADADLMFIGEGPGATEDQQGLPFVGRAGKLLDTLLSEIGLDRSRVFIANTVKCRPPGNRDPHPDEIESCHRFLRAQVQLIEPTVICTLGNFATKLLRADPTGISRLHGVDEVRTVGDRAVRLLPLFHPAAALYTPSTLQTLRDDFARIPELLARDAPPQPAGDASPAWDGPFEDPGVPDPQAPGRGNAAEPPTPVDARSQLETDPSEPQPQDEPEDRSVGPLDAEQLGLF